MPKEETPNGPSLPEIRLPGEYPQPDGTVDTVGHDRFCEEVVRILLQNNDILRQPGGLALVQDGGALRAMTESDLRIIVDASMRLVKPGRGPDPKPVYCPCTRAIARFIKERLGTDQRVPACDTTSSYPVWGRTSKGAWVLANPGYSPATRHYYLPSDGLKNLRLVELTISSLEDRKRVRNLISTEESSAFSHFPFENRASSVNLLAAALTLLLRPGIKDAVPIFAVCAPLPRTGKTLLVRVLSLLACCIEPHIRSFPSNPEEVRKGLSSALREGHTLLLFDNLPTRKHLDSGAFAAFVTAPSFTDRVIGTSQSPAMPNRTVPFVTGNNVSMSRELALRTVPIVLQPKDDNPHLRSNLPSITTLIEESRIETQTVLHGMIAGWVKAGCPKGPSKGLGGFETWSEIVGGILTHWGLGDEFLANLEGWRQAADSEADDVARFLMIWAGSELQGKACTAKALLPIVTEEGLFPDVLANRKDTQHISLAKTVLRPLSDVTRRLRGDDGIERDYRVTTIGSARSKRARHYQLKVEELASKVEAVGGNQNAA